MISKCNYFYIDESGGILNDSPHFILGCIRTDTPQQITESIQMLLNGFEDELYYAPMFDQILLQGFHAVDNHPDIRARFFALLATLNFRSFFSIINKSMSPYKEMIEQRDEKRVYLVALDKLLRGRFNNSIDKNIFVFEELQFKVQSQQKILDEFFSSYIDRGNVEYSIVGKEEINLSIVDYMNYIFNILLTKSDLSKVQRMVDNFELVKPKIAFIHLLNSNTFFSRRKSYSIENIVQTFNGLPLG